MSLQTFQNFLNKSVAKGQILSNALAILDFYCSILSHFPIQLCLSEDIVLTYASMAGSKLASKFLAAKYLGQRLHACAEVLHVCVCTAYAGLGATVPYAVSCAVQY